MANLRVESSALHNLAGKVESSTADFKTSLDKIINQNAELKTVWKGSDIDSYSAKVTEQAEEMGRFHKTLTELGAYMHNTATEYQNAQDTNRSMVNR